MRISPLRPVTPKGLNNTRKHNQPNAKQRKVWSVIASFGCSVCKAIEPELHHALTGAGGRKDHNKIFPLCYFHHRGEKGIHTIGRKAWQLEFGTEQSHLDKIMNWLKDRV